MQPTSEEREVTTYIPPQERLIVALDLPKAFRESVDPTEAGEEYILQFCDRIAELGVVIKLNSLLRAAGYRLGAQIRARGLLPFDDLKLIDIPNTLENDGALLRNSRPSIVTAMCCAGAPALRTLSSWLPNTKVFGVTILTSQTAAEVDEMYGCSIEVAVIRLARIAKAAGIEGVVCAPAELENLRACFGDTLQYITPNIRPAWAPVPEDDQNRDRSMGVAEALRAGASQLVVGRPITEAPAPRTIIRGIIEEIASVYS